MKRAKLKALRDLLLMHGISPEAASEIVQLLERECPWFGEADEVSEEIGVEMLKDVLPPQIAAVVSASRLVDWHNEHTRDPARETAITAAYEALVAIVRRFGIEDGHGSGDFWVMEDSFSGSNQATVMVFKAPPLPPGLQEAVVGWLRSQSAMKKIVLVDPEGDPLFESSRK